MNKPYPSEKRYVAEGPGNLFNFECQNKWEKKTDFEVFVKRKY